MTTSNNNNNIDDASQQFCVRWNSHLGSLGAAFPQLLAGQQFVDVTLACEGHQLHCHRLVLAACSSFFESLLGESPCKHPIIILPRDIKLWEIQALVDFMYKGEVNVSQAGLTDLLKCAEILQIRGLSGNDSTVNLNTIKDNTTQPATTTIDNNLMQNELLLTNNNNINNNNVVGNQQQQQQKIDTNNIKNNNTIVSETQQVQSSIDNKLITQLNNSNDDIPISTLSNNLPIISSSSDNNINSNILSINSSKFTKLLTDTNTIIYHHEKNKSIDDNLIKNNDNCNEDEVILSRDKIIKNHKQLCLQNNFNSDITTASKNPSTTATALINNNNSINCKINKIDDKLSLFKKVSVKHENIQKYNIKCGNNNNSGPSKTITTDIIPFVIPKTEPFDTSIYDESIDDTILNDDETDLMNIDNKSNNDDFPLSNVVCEYDSNGLQINMETPGRRVRRSEAILRQAAECVSKGQTFQTVSDMFSIPISTIRFFMARKGILPRRKRGRTAGMTVIGSNVVNSGIGGIIRNSTIGENNNNSNNLTSIENSRSASPLEPPFHFATYKLPELKPKLL